MSSVFNRVSVESTLNFFLSGKKEDVKLIVNGDISERRIKMK